MNNSPTGARSAETQSHTINTKKKQQQQSKCKVIPPHYKERTEGIAPLLEGGDWSAHGQATFIPY
jgi:hypothetical protein